MATKKELEARVEALELEVALLRARPSQTIVLPAPSYPQYWQPYWYPQIWCGSGSIPGTSSGQVAVN